MGTGFASRTARLLVRCYPPAWQARYVEELRALLDDLGPSRRTTAGLALGAARAWLRSDRHLLDRSGRMRSTMGVVLCAWVALTGLALIFGQVTEGLQLTALTPDHDATAAWYRIYEVAAIVSVAVTVGCGLPLWLSMARRAWRRGSRMDLMLLSMPLTIPAGFVAVLIMAVQYRGNPRGGLGKFPFLLLCALGLAAGVAIAACLAAALRSLKPAGRELSIAVCGAAAGAIAMVTAGTASVVCAALLALWDPAQYGARYYGWPLAGYVAVLAIAAITSFTSSARGIAAIRRRSPSSP